MHAHVRLTVKGSKEVDEKGEKGHSCSVVCRHRKGCAGGKQTPGHVGKGKEEQAPSSKRVNRLDGRKRKEGVDCAKAQRSGQGLFGRVASLGEDGAAVEGHDVDAAHLLSDHDDKGAQRGSPHARDGKELDEALAVRRGADGLLFQLHLHVCAVEITSGLQGRVAETTEAEERLRVPLLLEKPAG